MTKKTAVARPSLAAMTKLAAELEAAREEIARLRTVKEKWFDAYHALQKDVARGRNQLEKAGRHLTMAAEVSRLANMTTFSGMCIEASEKCYDVAFAGAANGCNQGTPAAT